VTQAPGDNTGHRRVEYNGGGRSRPHDGAIAEESRAAPAMSCRSCVTVPEPAVVPGNRRLSTAHADRHRNAHETGRPTISVVAWPLAPSDHRNVLRRRLRRRQHSVAITESIADARQMGPVVHRSACPRGLCPEIGTIGVSIQNIWQTPSTDFRIRCSPRPISSWTPATCAGGARRGTRHVLFRVETSRRSTAIIVRRTSASVVATSWLN